jgi:phage recombination protein Bet
MAQALALQENEDGKTSQEVLATFERPRIPWHPRLEETLGLDRLTWKTIIDTIFPGAKTADSVVTAINYCRARGLDVMKRPVHVVSMWSTAQNKMVESVWPGISELRTTAFRTKDYAGCDETKFGKMQTTKFEGVVDVWDRGNKTGTRKIEAEVTFPEWAQVTVYRMVQGQRVAFSGPKVYWSETYASIGKTDVPNDMWKERPIGQLEKCAEAAALRKAFPEELGGANTAEEMAGRNINDEIEGQGVVVPPTGQDAPLMLSPARAPDPEPPKAEARPAEAKVPAQVTALNPTIKVAEPVAIAETGVASTGPSPEAPDLPGFLDRRSESRLSKAEPEPAPAAVMEDDFPGDKPSTQEETQETAEDVIKEAEDHFASAKSEEEIDQFYTEGDFEARLEPFVGGVEKARSLRDQARRRFTARPDPFLIPDRFRDAQHVSDWADAAIAATVSLETAEKLRAIWSGSKARRAEVLTSETNKPIYDRVSAQVGKFSAASSTATAQPTTTQAVPAASATTATAAPSVTSATALDPTEAAKTTAQYFAQAETVLTWDDPDKLWSWTNDTWSVREELGIGQDGRWKKMKSRLIDRRDVLKAKKA